MVAQEHYFKYHACCCHIVADLKDYTAHIFNFYELYASDVKIYPGLRFTTAKRAWNFQVGSGFITGISCFACLMLVLL